MKAKKLCRSCGRPMTYRRKWAENWDEVKYCSKACRGKGVPAQLMSDIVQLLNQREPGKTICPSDVLDGEHKKNRQKMERVRDAARLLAHEGEIVILQKGRRIDPSNFKGPIRLGKP